MLDYNMDVSTRYKGTWGDFSSVVCYRGLHHNAYDAVKIKINQEGRKTQYMESSLMEVILNWFPWIKLNIDYRKQIIEFPVEKKENNGKYSINVGTVLRLGLEEPYKQGFWLYLSTYGEDFDYLRLLATINYHRVRSGVGDGHTFVPGLVIDPIILTPKKIYDRMDRNSVYKTWQPTFQTSFSSNSFKTSPIDKLLNQYVEAYLESVHTV